MRGPLLAAGGMGFASVSQRPFAFRGPLRRAGMRVQSSSTCRGAHVIDDANMANGVPFNGRMVAT